MKQCHLQQKMRSTSSLCGLGAMAFALGFGAPFAALAGPAGGQVASGSATISQQAQRTDIRQNSHRVVIDWTGFDVAPNETVQFHQPSANSAALNRVNSKAASRIAGNLKANGNVVIVNPNGVVFEGTSKVDVNGLIATTADINNADFMAGNLNFSKAGNPNAAVINHGQITAREAGLVGLVAPRVENHGLITAKLGKVQLASGDTFSVDLYGDGLFEVAVSDAVSKQLVHNTGRIDAQGGTIAITAATGKNIVDSLIKVEGELNTPTFKQQGGEIIIGDMTALKSHGTARVSGTIKADAQHKGQTSGNITITAKHVAIEDTALISASGPSGGGIIHIGGEYQGKGETATAYRTYVAPNAEINANATYWGDGGEVVVWADDSTYFYGRINAAGGPQGGNGGFAEVSGMHYLRFDGDVDLSGDELGTLLLDPDDIDVVAGGADPAEFADDSILFAENGGATSTIGADTITTRLSANANVILQANNTIDVNAAITSTGSGNLTLQTSAGGTITVNSAIDVNTGDLTLQADEIDILANLSGSGDIQLTSADTSQAIEIGSGTAGSLNITAAEIAFLQNGWNQLTIGATDLLAGISIAESVSFANNTIIRQDQANATAGITTSSTTNSIGTTDGANLSFYGDNSYSSQNWVPSGVSGDVLFDGFSTLNLQNSSITGNLTVQNVVTAGFHSAATINVGGDASFNASSSFTLGYSVGTNLNVDGNIDVTSTSVSIHSGSTISGNADGSSTLTFLEAGEDAAMEIGGTSAGHTWQMTDDEFATIQDGFSSITFGSASSTGDVAIESLDLSALGSNVAFYGNDIDLGGITMGAGNVLVHAIDNGGDLGDIDISADITRAVDGVATLDLRADANIFNSNNADIIASDANSDADADATTSADSLTVILNADRNADDDGAINLTNATITTLGGNFTAGGGADPTTTAAHAGQDGVYDVGVKFSNADIDTGTGNIIIRGEGENTGDDNYGIQLTGSTLATTSGNVTLDGVANGASRARGVLLNNGHIQTADGDIQLMGYRRRHCNRE
jgi:filamentous hemagglutinin family protein